MKHASTLILIGLVGLPLLAQITSPRVGTARYADGSFHSVQGLPSNMIVADLPMESADAASFSDAGGVIARNGKLQLLAADYSVLAEQEVAETPMVSIGADLNSALTWLPNAHTLMHWNGSSFDSFDLAASDVEGVVTDVEYAGAKRARLLVHGADDSVSAVTISLRNGGLVSSEPLPGVRGYAFEQGLFLVYADQQELVADNLRGYRRSVALPAQDFVVERMSTNWLHIYSPGLHQHWALHLTQAELQLSMLPGLPEQKGTTAVAGANKGIK